MRGLWVFGWMLLALGVVEGARVSGPLLPDWSEKEIEGRMESGWVAGALLLTDEPVPEEEQEEADAGAGAVELDVAQPTAEEIADSEAPTNEIPEEYWPEYFNERPEQFLVDPQGLLSSVDYRDRLEFLNYHAGDSPIDLFVYLFKGDQEIPGEVREEELIEKFYSQGRPSAVVYYFMGAPQRSVIYLTPSLTDVVSAAEQRRALESSVMQAFEKVDQVEQIEAFLVQMSIRIYWMERMLDGGLSAEGDEAFVAVADPEAAGGKDADEPAESAMPGEWIKRYSVLAMVVVASLACGLGAVAWIRSRARFRFPEFDVEPRLGGAHAAGIGAVISFASASVPPASQRDQVPDYLRRM
ncbi:MAG: hypothetical protein Q7R22_013260 [Verrucomicrobiota bacterium JB025]|nr:hypothetical protein [Verrucomicrobiota bacterium JB025]